MLLKDGEVVLHSCRAHRDFATLARNAAVFCEQEETSGVRKLAGKFTDVFYTAVLKQNQRGDCV